MANTTETLRIDFPTRVVFPPDNPLSVSVLRLAAATNDVRTIQKSTLIAMEKSAAANAVEAALLEGELGYFIRLLLGHLHEAGIVFRDLDAKHHAELDALIAANREAMAEIVSLRTAYGDASPASLNKFLESVRSPWAFHYKLDRFKEALVQHPERATIIVSEFAGVGRYTITDDFAKHYMVQKAGSAADFQRLVGDAIILAGTLGRAVDHLLGELFARRAAPLEQTRAAVRVPEELVRARDRVRQRS